jgi:P63C domain
MEPDKEHQSGDDRKQPGRAAGGLARAAALSDLERSEQAKAAATKRWSEPVPRATHGSTDHPLKIGPIELPCYVLEDGRRVLSMSGLITGLGMKKGSAGRGGDRLVSFAVGKSISEFISPQLAKSLSQPIKFVSPSSGPVIYGYEATTLPDLCDAVLNARKEQKLQKQQEHIAVQCELLVRGLARVGIIALIDEATGYQKDRTADALARILESFIAKELQPWVKTFPADYYEQLFRLRGLDYQRDTPKRPQYFGVLTNDIIYRRLAPGVLEELKRVSVKADSGRPKHKLFQLLTQNIGYPKLREHLGSVVTLMKLSDEYNDFKRKLDRIHPHYGKTLPLPFDDVDVDDGRGL